MFWERKVIVVDSDNDLAEAMVPLIGCLVAIAIVVTVVMTAFAIFWEILCWPQYKIFQTTGYFLFRSDLAAIFLLLIASLTVLGRCVFGENGKFDFAPLIGYGVLFTILGFAYLLWLAPLLYMYELGYASDKFYNPPKEERPSFLAPIIQPPEKYYQKYGWPKLISPYDPKGKMKYKLAHDRSQTPSRTITTQQRDKAFLETASDIPQKIQLSAPIFSELLESPEMLGVEWEDVPQAEFYKVHVSDGEKTIVEKEIQECYYTLESHDSCLPGRGYTFTVWACRNLEDGTRVESLPTHAVLSYPQKSADKEKTDSNRLDTPHVQTKLFDGIPYLTWDEVPHAEKYRVEYQSEQTKKMQARFLVKTRISLKNLKPGSVGYFTVTALPAKTSDFSPSEKSTFKYAIPKTQYSDVLKGVRDHYFDQDIVCPGRTEAAALYSISWKETSSEKENSFWLGIYKPLNGYRFEGTLFRPESFRRKSAARGKENVASRTCQGTLSEKKGVVTLTLELDLYGCKNEKWAANISEKTFMKSGKWIDGDSNLILLRWNGTLFQGYSQNKKYSFTMRKLAQKEANTMLQSLYEE